MARPQRDMQKINLYMPRATWAAIQEFAKIQETTASDIIRNATKAYVSEEVTKMANNV